MKKTTKGILLSTLMVSGLFIGLSEQASAHGYVESPHSRAYQAKLDTSALGWDAAHNLYGEVITQPQGLEAPKGFPMAGPADGSIASANGALGDSKLDNQTTGFWTKQAMNTGINSFTWFYTAAHNTSKWHYYMTNQNWNPNAPLTRNDLELIGTIEHDGSSASNNLTHQVNVPTDRSGYNIILAVWDVSDTPNAFYQVIDVDIKNDGVEIPTPEVPKAPTALTTANITASSLELSWTAPTNTAVKEYNVYRDGKHIRTISGTTYTETDLSAATRYEYTVEAVSFTGEVSEKSAVMTVTTTDIPEIDTEAPTAPTGVHSMETTDSLVDLMWTKSAHSVGVKRYDIYRDGKTLSSSTTTMFKDETVKPSTAYSYTIKAVSLGGIESEMSSTFKVTTKTKEVVAPADNAWVLGTFTNPVEYKVGQIVTHNGKTYKTLNGHLNYGDANWAPDKAASLFQEIPAVTEEVEPVDNAWVLGSFSKPVEYKVGQIVTHKGKTYKTLNGHLNYGDANWAPDKAASLFQEIPAVTEEVKPVDNVWVLGSFSKPVEYKVSQIVTHKGKTYRTVNGHLNYGDANWAPDKAATLFQEV